MTTPQKLVRTDLALAQVYPVFHTHAMERFTDTLPGSTSSFEVEFAPRFTTLLNYDARPAPASAAFSAL